jgi:N,N'-diacetyllegionaminate synthase
VRTLIVAEAGVNHNGDERLAHQLVDVAADAGADRVKFQTVTADALVTTGAGKAEYQNKAGDVRESQHAMLRKLELSPQMHTALIEHCRARGIGFFSTAFDLLGLQQLLELGAEEFKIPSGEVTNLPYLRRVGSYGRPIILSTGMCTLGEIETALAVLERSGTPLERVTVLHCTTEYPAPMEEVNLRAMSTIREAFGVAVGYSDHTLGIEVALAAVAMGARVIEKHFTIDRTLPGPDHAASLEPAELKALVRGIRNIERALGSTRKAPTPSESRNMAVARKSLVAARTIRRGERFSETNVTAKRPGTGISPMRWDDVIGRTATRDFSVDDLIEV